jgi:hypothetical protein
LLPWGFSAAIVVGGLLVLTASHAGGDPAATAGVEPTRASDAAEAIIEQCMIGDGRNRTWTVDGAARSIAGAPAGDTASTDTGYVYVTVIQSKGIPVPGVYAAATPATAAPLLSLHPLDDPRSIC